ncbi:MAG: glycoside hydrolase, family 16 [Fibrobacteres bacterium]|nr:glycoside hydrolase, family 16 [Fibrobacterota bacterium]
MRFSLIHCLACAFLCAAAARAQSGWDLTLSDEFNGPANTYPDPAKWNVEVNGNPPNAEAEAYVKSLRNVSLNGLGQLELIALHEPSGGKQYTSGKVNSSGRFVQTYGRWEARIKLPAGTGFWPAFWMLGINNGCGGWPSCGEIDIIENRGRLARTSSSAMHGPGYSGNTPLAHTYNLPAGSPSFFDDYHLFAAEWDATSVKFYVDSTLHYTVNKTDVQRYGNWVYNHDFYILINLAVGGQFDGGQIPPASAFPAKVMVDYVHVYKPGTGPIIVALRPERLTPREAASLPTLTAYDFSGRLRPSRESPGALTPMASRSATGAGAISLCR